MALTRDEVLGIWRPARDLTRQVAAAMPPEHGSFAPWPGAMTFAELILHILSAEKTLVEAIKARNGQFIWDQGLSTASFPDLPAVMQLLTDLTAAHDAFFASLSDADYATPLVAPWGTFPLWHFVEEWARHEAHHRGQMYVYMRLCGVQPPDYHE